MAAVAEKSQAFGRLSAYVRTIGYSTTVLLLMIPTVVETLTWVPPGAPLVASPEEPVFKPILAALFVLFLIGAGLQVRTLWAAARQGR